MASQQDPTYVWTSTGHFFGPVGQRPEDDRAAPAAMAGDQWLPACPAPSSESSPGPRTAPRPLPRPVEA